MVSELMPFGQLFDRVNKAAYKYDSLTDCATRVGFPIKADYSADSYESREGRKVGSHLADMERELNLAKDTDKRGGFKRESGHFGQEGKQIYEAHPEYLAIKSAQSDVARRVSQISDLQAKAKAIGYYDRAGDLDRQISEIRGRFARAANENNLSELKKLSQH